jgi:hypothetical protein
VDDSLQMLHGESDPLRGRIGKLHSPPSAALGGLVCCGNYIWAHNACRVHNKAPSVSRSSLTRTPSLIGCVHSR